MTKNTSVSLGSHFDKFIAGCVKKGRYGTASDVIRAGLRLLETNEAQLDTLRTMLSEGEKSGFTDYTYDKLIEELDKENH